MRKIAFIVGLYLILSVVACAQVPSPTPAQTLVDQSFIDSATKAFDLVVSLRDALQKEQMANGASTVTKAALQTQIDALNGLMVIYERKDAVYESLVALDAKKDLIYEQALKIEQSIIDALSKQLGKGDSAFKKFLNGVKHAVEIIIAYAVGRAVVPH